mgnify:CR=1 FL=1
MRNENEKDSVLFCKNNYSEQFTVQFCTNNPPDIEAIEELCVLAGTNVSIEVNASDPDDDPVILTALGGPLTETDNLASFSNPSDGLGFFSWNEQKDDGYIDVDWFKYDYDGPKGKNQLVF